MREMIEVSDLGAVGGALLAGLLEPDWGNCLDQRRAADVASSNETYWSNRYNALVGRYNLLLADAEKLARKKDETTNVLESHIAFLTQTNDTMSAERAEFRRTIAKLTMERDAFSQLISDQSGSYYRLDRAFWELKADRIKLTIENETLRARLAALEQKTGT